MVRALKWSNAESAGRSSLWPTPCQSKQDRGNEDEQHHAAGGYESRVVGEADAVVLLHCVPAFSLLA